MCSFVSGVLLGLGVATGAYAAGEVIDHSKTEVARCVVNLDEEPQLVLTLPEGCEDFRFPTIQTIDSGVVVDTKYHLPPADEFVGIRKG